MSELKWKRVKRLFLDELGGSWEEITLPRGERDPMLSPEAAIAAKGSITCALDADFCPRIGFKSKESATGWDFIALPNIQAGALAHLAARIATIAGMAAEGSL